MSLGLGAYQGMNTGGLNGSDPEDRIQQEKYQQMKETSNHSKDL